MTDKFTKARKNRAFFSLKAALGRFCLWIAQLKGAKRQGFAFVLGALTALALPPFYAVTLCFISFPALVLLLDAIAQDNPIQTGRIRRKSGLTALTGWSFGFGYFTAGLWWLADAMTVDIAQFGWAIPFAVFGLPAFLACYYGLATALAFLFWQKGLIRLFALSLAFALAEYLRGILFTGFPWNAIGYTAMPCPLFMQADAVIGLNGMNAFAVFLYSLPALFRRNSPFYKNDSAKFGLILGFMLISADIGFGSWRLAQAETEANAAPLRIRIVQPAIAQEEKQNAEVREENFAGLLALSRAAPRDGGKRPDLIIWPETSVPYLLEYNEAALAQISRNLQQGQSLLAGAVRVEEKRQPQTAQQDSAGNSADNMHNKESITARYRFFNSMLLINSSGRIIAYADKTHLVPFGEYLPLAAWSHYFGLKTLAKLAGPYSAAKQRQFITLPGKISILPLICYEAIFPQEARAGHGKTADIIVNITNDAWFGNTPGPRQHLAQARLRAVEQNRPLIRAANNGISAYIDSRGRIRASLPLDKTGFLDIDLKIPMQAAQ